MTPPLPLTIAFSRFLSEQMGLHFPLERTDDMLRGLRRAVTDLGFTEVESCMRRLMHGPLSQTQIETLAGHLSIGETYFFRDPPFFQALERDILPPLIAARRSGSRHLRFWSAGCATGEEPYSLAIMLERLLPDLAEWDVSILATDINPAFISRAKQARYGEWSFRGAPAWLKSDCFERHGSHGYVLAQRYRENVRFAYLNLAEDCYPNVLNGTFGMDVILCRNVLMYFDEAKAASIAKRFASSLMTGGWLAVNPVETSRTIFGQFSAVSFPGALLYRNGRPAGVPAPAACRRAPAPTSGVCALVSEPVRPDVDERLASGRLEFARAAFDAGEYEAAIAALGSVDAECASLETLSLLARASANLGRLADARRWCEQAVAADKLNPGVRYLQAVILIELEQLDAARDALREVLYLAPDHVMAHFMLARTLKRLGARQPAARHFAAARALLAPRGTGDMVPDADGLTVGRVRALIERMEGAH